MGSSGKKIGGIFPTVIIACDCQNAGQDLIYGKGMRAMNALGGKASGFKCTVCGKIRQVSVKR